MRLFQESARRRSLSASTGWRRTTLVAVVATIAWSPHAALAQGSASEDANTAFVLRTSIKASALIFRAPEARELFPDRLGAESLWRFRIEPELRLGASTAFVVAYEQRLRYASTRETLAGAGILPSQAAPFRLRPLDWSLAKSSSASWRHEIDRANVRVHTGRAEFTLGRQAIGWGRGVLFGAVDIFAPFSPLEADREWRRGVDAFRADVKLTDRSSLDVVTAFGPSWDRSAVAARVRGYGGSIDVEAIGGKRARDWFAGATSSAAIGDVEVHGELAAFRVPADGLDRRNVWKSVAGGSYRFPIGSGIFTYVEYHYSGFGASRPEEILTLLSQPAFMERYLRGDMQILSRHTITVTASYETSPEVTWAWQWLQNPRDSSGILVSGLTYTVSDRVSWAGVAYVPYGRRPIGTRLRSEFGAASLSALLQLRLYL